MLISYPFLPESGSAEDMEMLTVGQFPASMDGQWHGGIHLKAPTTEPVRAIADGTVVAYRLSQELIKEREKDAEGLMDNSFVLLRHETETDVISIPGAAPMPVKVVFYSLYMHLMNVSTLTSQGRMNDLPACIQPSDGVVRGNGEKLYRKDIIGYPGQTYSTPGAIHFEIFATDDDFKRFFVDSANDPAGSRGVWGDAYFIIKKQAGDAKVHALSSLASIYPHALRTDPQAVDQKTMGGHTFEDGVEGDLDNDLFVRIRYDQGKKYTTTWINHGVDRPAELLTEETGEPDHDYEYAMYDIATALYPTCPSAGYELLRMGRILGPDSALLPQAEYKNYQLITYAEGKKGYIDLANDAVVRVLSDADFPYWMGWKKVDAGLVGSDGWVDMEALLRTLKLPVDEICGPLLPEQLARDYLQKHPHARDANRRLVCRFYNEWDKANNEVTYARLKEPDGLGAGINGPYLGDLEAFQAHMKFVEAMQWWSDAQEAVGDSNVWHFHPLGFIEHFRKCAWLSANEFKQLLPTEVLREAGTHGLYYEDVAYSRSRSDLASAYRIPLNSTLRKYTISTPERMAAFFGNSLQETQWLEKLHENNRDEWYYPWGGRGFLQLTHSSNYIGYWDFRGRKAHISETTRDSLAHAQTEANQHRAQAQMYLADPVSGVTSVMVTWREQVGAESQPLTPEDSLAPADSAGYYWAKMGMGRCADKPTVLERRAVTATRPPDPHHPQPNQPISKIYYHSMNFRDASAAVNLPNAVGHPNTPFNGYVARCVAYAQALAVLADVKFPDASGAFSLGFPEGRAPRRD